MNHWTKTIVFSLMALTGFLLVVSLVLPSGMPRTRTDEELAWLDVGIHAAMEDYHIPGVQLAWIERGTIDLREYGVYDMDRSTGMEDDILFRAQSLSKTLTAVLILHLVETDVLDLEDTLADVLPSSFLEEIPEVFHDGTIHAILKHEARMPLGDFNRMFPAYEEDIMTLEEALIQDLNQGPSKAGFFYSNVGYNLLEYIINHVTPDGYEALAEAVVFNPLGMTNTTFSYDDVDPDRLAVGDNAFGKEVDHYRYPELGSGGLLTTASDWARFLIAWLDGDIVSQATLDTMGTFDPDVGLGSYGMAFDGYGYGVFVEETEDDTFLAHGGQGYGFMAFFHIDAASKTGYVVMTNSQRTYPMIAMLSRGLYQEEHAGFPSIGNIHRLMVGMEVLIGGLLFGLAVLLWRMIHRRWLQHRVVFVVLGLLSVATLGFLMYFLRGNYLFLHVLIPIHFEWLMGVLGMGSLVVLVWLGLSVPSTWSCDRSKKRSIVRDQGVEVLFESNWKK